MSFRLKKSRGQQKVREIKVRQRKTRHLCTKILPCLWKLQIAGRFKFLLFSRQFEPKVERKKFYKSNKFYPRHMSNFAFRAWNKPIERRRRNDSIMNGTEIEPLYVQFNTDALCDMLGMINDEMHLSIDDFLTDITKTKETN